jgi:hypothetical protein
LGVDEVTHIQDTVFFADLSLSLGLSSQMSSLLDLPKVVHSNVAKRHGEKRKVDYGGFETP